MLHKSFRFPAVLVALTTGSLLALSTATQSPITTDIDKQAEDAGKKEWADYSRQGAELAKKHDIAEVMALFKLRKAPGAMGGAGGAGVGPMQGAILPDGIDHKINAVAKNAMDATQLAKEKAALLQLAQRVSAIASVTVHQCPVEKKDGAKDPALWKKWMEEMHNISNDLAKELKKDTPDPAKVRNHMINLKANCAECHSTFRDAP